MKYFIFGDMHGKDLKPLSTILENENPDILLCLCDFDRVETINQFIELEKKYKTIKVPGNHDHAILNNIPIYSGTMDIEGLTSSGLNYELKNDPAAKKFIDGLVNSGNEKVEFFLDEEKFGQEYKAILIHGALAGTFWGEPVNLWCRILDNEDYRKNFLKMEEKGYNIMIRGHDHEQNCVSVQYKTENKNEKNIKNHLVTPKNAMKEIKKVELTRNFNDRYIINPGSFYGGYYAILDTNIPGQKIPVINFYKLKPEDVY